MTIIYLEYHYNKVLPGTFYSQSKHHDKELLQQIIQFCPLAAVQLSLVSVASQCSMSSHEFVIKLLPWMIKQQNTSADSIPFSWQLTAVPALHFIPPLWSVAPPPTLLPSPSPSLLILHHKWGMKRCVPVGTWLTGMVYTYCTLAI